MGTKKLISLVFFTFLLIQIYGANDVNVIYPNGAEAITPNSTSFDVNVQIKTSETKGLLDLYLCESSSCNLKYPLALDLNIAENTPNWDCNATNFCHADINLVSEKITLPMHDQNLLFYWTFDSSNISSDAQYMSKSIAQALTKRNNPTKTAGYDNDGNAVKYTNAGTQYLDATNNNNFDKMSNELTAIAWVYLDTLVQYPWIINNGYDGTKGFAYYVRRSDQADANQIKVLGHFGGGGNESFTSTVKLDLGRWYHTAIVYNSANLMTLYIDGNNSGSATFTGDVTPPTATFNINRYPATGLYGDMRVDEVKLFDRALSQAEIISDFNTNGRGGYYDVNSTGWPNREWVIVGEFDNSATQSSDSSDGNFIIGIGVPPVVSPTHYPPKKYFSPTELKDVDSNRYLDPSDYRDRDENVYYSRFDLRGQDKTAIKHDTEQTIQLYFSFAIIIAVILIIIFNRRRLG